MMKRQNMSQHKTHNFGTFMQRLFTDCNRKPRKGKKRERDKALTRSKYKRFRNFCKPFPKRHFETVECGKHKLRNGTRALSHSSLIACVHCTLCIYNNEATHT